MLLPVHRHRRRLLPAPQARARLRRAPRRAPRREQHPPLGGVRRRLPHVALQVPEEGPDGEPEHLAALRVGQHLLAHKGRDDVRLVTHRLRATATTHTQEHRHPSQLDAGQVSGGGTSASAGAANDITALALNRRYPAAP